MALRRTLVAVVHDDESVREWLPDLLGALGFEARAFASAEEFLVSDCLPDTGCVVLDIRLSGMSGTCLRHFFCHSVPIRFPPPSALTS